MAIDLNLPPADVDPFDLNENPLLEAFRDRGSNTYVQPGTKPEKNLGGLNKSATVT
jgi:hypothetical protein